MLVMELSDVCPDCRTPLRANSGPRWCETCWRIVPLSVRGLHGIVVPTGRWMRLPPHLQHVTGLVEALRGAVPIDKPGKSPTYG